MGAGEVWVDDVQVFSLAFNKSEMVELSKLITQAGRELQNGRIGDCMRLLDGYWPRFLEENVPLPPGTGAMEAADTEKKPPAEEKPPEPRVGSTASRTRCPIHCGSDGDGVAENAARQRSRIER